MIEVKNLVKYFGKKWVLKGVNLHIKRGETMVIIGRSGCGKSVLMKHVIGLFRPDGGEVLIDGESMPYDDDKKMNAVRMKMGLLFQGSALFDSLTVGENVGFAYTEHTKKSNDEISLIVKRCLADVGLRDIEELRPSEISGGMQKRVGLARAIAMTPQVMLYDEPTTGLDPIMADAINDLIIELSKKLKVTSIAVTHDMVSAYKIADRIAMLYDGEIIEIGTPEEIQNTKNPYVYQFTRGLAKGPIKLLE